MTKKIKSYMQFMLMMGLVFGIFYAIGVGLVSSFLPGTELANNNTSSVVEDKKRITILFLGVDARPGDTTNARADTIILASIDPTRNKVAVVSIPRDTQIDGAAGSGMDKINSANVTGGPELAVKKVESLMGEKIDYYVEMNFEGFKKIVDTLGGVSINVDQRMYKPTEDINLQPGVQRLDGREALAFVRYRGYVQGDIERTAHQQEFIKALGKELLQPATIAKLPQLIREANTYVDTDLRLTDMLKMATWAPGFNSESIIAQTLPGYFLDKRDANGVLTASYWVADTKQASTLLDKMLDGQTVAVLVDAPASAQNTVVRTSKVVPEVKEKTPILPKQETPADKDKINWERSNLPSPGHGDIIIEKQV
ncbi:MAG: LCP family protein [Syntrophomonas sp.]|nr:LCP family protein [Syntrophomonas sp.]